MLWQKKIPAEITILSIFPDFLFLSQSQLWSALRIVMATEIVSLEHVTVSRGSSGLTAPEVT